jgi:hypothetical protein
MSFKNKTRNQHFISQVEQRFNAINPNAKRENQKIYKFDLIDRESYSIKLHPENGMKITNSLSFNDLFSFDILINCPDRDNFEKLFQQYEYNLKNNTESLLNKIYHKNDQSDIKSELLNIFIAKFMNFIRNPHSITKVLNTFPQLTKVRPTNLDQYKIFNRVINGNKPQKEYICKYFGISDNEYSDWLKIIYMLLINLKETEESNLLEMVVRSLFENTDNIIFITIYTYKYEKCLLSDRGFSIPLPEEYGMSFDFNLCSNAFIQFIFGDIDKLVGSDITKEIIESYKKISSKEIFVDHIEDDLDALKKYNRNVVYQCFNTVFNSSQVCFGVEQSD